MNSDRGISVISSWTGVFVIFPSKYMSATTALRVDDVHRDACIVDFGRCRGFVSLAARG